MMPHRQITNHDVDQMAYTPKKTKLTPFVSYLPATTRSSPPHGPKPDETTSFSAHQAVSSPRKAPLATVLPSTAMLQTDGRLHLTAQHQRNRCSQECDTPGDGTDSKRVQYTPTSCIFSISQPTRGGPVQLVCRQAWKTVYFGVCVDIEHLVHASKYAKDGRRTWYATSEPCSWSVSYDTLRHRPMAEILLGWVQATLP